MFYFTQAFFKILIVLVLAVTAPCAAEDVKHLKKEARDVKRKLQQDEARVKDFDRKEQDVLDQLDGIDRSIQTARQAMKATKENIAALSDGIAATEKAFAALEKEIAAGETHAARRMVSLYKLSSLGRLHILASAGSATEFFQRKAALSRVLDHDTQLIEQLDARKTELLHLQDQLDAQRQERVALEATHQERVAELDRQRKRRETLLGEIRREKSMAKASVAALKKAGAALDEKIRTLQTPPRADTGKKSEPGTFQTFKGLLEMPVRGKIVSFFGAHKDTELDIVNFQSGINIQADRGSPIRSVLAGTVIYAGWFKGYGNMIIIDHSDHYYTLYAHAEELFKGRGDTVGTGEVIGTAGETGTMPGPGIHFEVRFHGKPLDPLKWLKKG